MRRRLARDGVAHELPQAAAPADLANDGVTAICENRSEMLGIGTYESGLNRFDRRRGTFARYDERHGLPNNVVYGILEDDRGRLWLSTNRGLSRFDPRTATFRSYDVHDGLQSSEFNSGAYHRGDRGIFYFGGNSGFNAFDPERVLAQRPDLVVSRSVLLGSGRHRRFW